MDSQKRNYSPHSVMLCIHSTSYVLSIWNFLGRLPLVWKFPVESANSGERILDTAVRAGLEEGGLAIPAVRGKTGVIERLGDAEMKVEFVSVDQHKGHARYFYKVRISDERLLSLSDRLLRADTDELLWTWAFPFMHPFKMTNFHQWHLRCFETMIQSKRYTA